MRAGLSRHFVPIIIALCSALLELEHTRDKSRRLLTTIRHSVMKTMNSSYAPSNAACFGEASRPYLVDEAMYVITRAEDAFGNVIEETCRLVRPRPIKGAPLRRLSEVCGY